MMVGVVLRMEVVEVTMTDGCEINGAMTGVNEIEVGMMLEIVLREETSGVTMAGGCEMIEVIAGANELEVGVVVETILMLETVETVATGGCEIEEEEDVGKRMDEGMRALVSERACSSLVAAAAIRTANS
jgi:hypothetical protein